MPQSYIRELIESDFSFLKYLDSQVNWGFSQKSMDILLGYSKTAFIAEDQVTQQPHGIVFTFYYPPRTGWIGLLIVDEVFQNQGIGKKLFSKSLDKLLKIGCQEILLDAVPDVVPFYKKYHFSEIEKSLRLKISFSNLLSSLNSSPRSIRTESDHLDDITKFDTNFFGAIRNRIFLNMLRSPKSVGAVYYHNKKIEGYGFIHYYKNSCSIGPLIAKNPSIALDIISKLTLIETGKKCDWILMGITESSRIPLQFFYELGFKEYDCSIRMRCGKNQRKSNPNHVYCIASPEMG